MFLSSGAVWIWNTNVSAGKSAPTQTRYDSDICRRGDGGDSGSRSARLGPGTASDGRTPAASRHPTLAIVWSSSIQLTLHCVGVPLTSVPGTIRTKNNYRVKSQSFNFGFVLVRVRQTQTANSPFASGGACGLCRVTAESRQV